MKKIITLCFAFLFAASFAFVETAKAQIPIDFGVKGGVNIATLAGPGDSPDSRTGILAGVAMDLSMPLFPLGIETGLYYSQKGAEDAEFDYLEVPILAKLSVGPPGPFTPHLLAGPYIAYNINAEIGGVDVSDNMNSTDFGVAFGAGADFNLMLTKINVQARYSLGLTSVYDSEFITEDFNNRAFTISVGVMF